MAKMLTCLGMMSGTSLDGVDVALLRTDGETVTEFGPSDTFPYEPDTKNSLLAALGETRSVDRAEKSLTWAHISAVFKFLTEHRINTKEIDLIGFHGQTILHRPQEGLTRQIGDGQLLADETGIQVVCDFRSADVKNGGEGAPFAPVYHKALARDMDHPIAVLNIGGVANVTWIDGEGIRAWDTGPGNALLDDWCRRYFDCDFDAGGEIARQGKKDGATVEELLSHPYFDRPPPKSLDRDDFAPWVVARSAHLSPHDGAATLLSFTVEAIAASAQLFPKPVKKWLVCGGGRHNQFLMEALSQRLGGEVSAVEKMGWNGDALEAQAFAFLAARSQRGIPLSYPTTTGVKTAMKGGVLFSPS